MGCPDGVIFDRRRAAIDGRSTFGAERPRPPGQSSSLPLDSFDARSTPNTEGSGHQIRTKGTQSKHARYSATSFAAI
jgi:hypothetical protein